MCAVSGLVCVHRPTGWDGMGNESVGVHPCPGVPQQRCEQASLLACAKTERSAASPLSALSVD